MSKVYVIGGIVDRTIVRGVTVKAAGQMGVRTARLPLEYLNVRMWVCGCVCLWMFVD